jgi:hypothetical protein
MLPEDREIASYLFSEKVNYIAHLNVGKRQQILFQILVAGSAVLSAVTGTLALSDVGKFWVGFFTVTSVATSTLVLVLLPSANWRNHKRVGSDYEALYQDTLDCILGNGKVNN